LSDFFGGFQIAPAAIFLSLRERWKKRLKEEKTREISGSLKGKGRGGFELFLSD